MTGLRLRFLWPVLLITGCLVVLCAVTAMSLFHQQATIARVLRENLASRRAATELGECVQDLISLANEPPEAVGPLHDRARAHLAELDEHADQPEERALFARVEAAFAEYLRLRQAVPPPGRPGRGE